MLRKETSCSKYMYGWHENIKFTTSNMSHQVALRFSQVKLQSLVPFSWIYIYRKLYIICFLGEGESIFFA